MSIFDFRRITRNDSYYEKIFRLRFQVYVHEWGFERAEDHPDGIEIDEFDKQGQCLYVGAILKETGELLGTARVIMLPKAAESFPVEDHYLGRNLFGEISRLAVTKQFNRRIDDLLNVVKLGNISELPEATPARVEQRNIENDIVFGLYRAICVESKKEGLEYWYAAMARGLYLLLKRRGVNFTPLGPEKDYHGLRRAYVGYIPDVLRENQVLLDAYTRGSF